MATNLSERKMEANRRNARKSTGPRTEAGKKKSRWNALKHGLTAKRTLVPGLENAKVYRKLLKGYLRDFKPEGVVEESLVQELVACHLQMIRGSRVERDAFLAAADEKVDECLDEELDEEELMAVRKMKKVKKAPKRSVLVLPDLGTMDTLARYQTSIGRHRQRVLEMLARRTAAPAEGEFSRRQVATVSEPGGGESK